jgi:hypothetical protein
MPEETFSNLPKILRSDAEMRASIKSKILQYPEKILDLIDAEIRKGYGSLSCMKVVKLNYQGTLVMPSRDTFERYIAERRKQFGMATDKKLWAEQQIANLPPAPSLRSISGEDKRTLLEATRLILAERIDKVREVQETQMDSRYEAILTNDLEAHRDIVIKQLDVDARLGLAQMKLQAVVNVLLKHLSQVIGQAYRDIHGTDKSDSFRKALEHRIDALNFDVIEQEVAAAMKEQEE